MTTLYERYGIHITGTLTYSCNTTVLGDATTYAGQAFTVGSTGENIDNYLTRIIIWARRLSSPGNCTVDIYKCDVAHKPTGASLDSVTFDADTQLSTNADGLEYILVFSGTVLLEKDIEYCWIAQSPCVAGNVVVHGGSTDAPCNNSIYDGVGRRLITTDAGANWTVSATRSLYTQQYGLGVKPPYTMTVTGNGIFK